MSQVVRAWRPDVPGVAEVLHARFVEHAYPMHTHDTWTLLIVDDGVIRYDLDRHHHDAAAAGVTLLPPHVPHDGRAATRHGFRKRVLYLDESTLPGHLVEGPDLHDPVLRQRIHQLHACLEEPAGSLEAQSRFAFIRERLLEHLGRRVHKRQAENAIAHRLRELLDEHVLSGLSLDEAAATLQSHPVHLVRSFSRAYGVAPHAYLTGRRIDRARRLLLSGHSVAGAAAESGFYDQAHLTRHFRRYLGTTPGRFVNANGGATAATRSTRPAPRTWRFTAP